jgi:hypothetical protein
MSQPWLPSASALQRLAADIERRRRVELNAEIAERRHFEAMGLDYRQVLAARAVAAAQALEAAAAARRIPQQLSIPGINPTLMALRSREPLTPEEFAATGVVRGLGWRRAPEPIGEQLELSMEPQGRGNQIVRFQRPTDRAGTAPAAAPPRMAGVTLSDVLGSLLVGGGLGLGSLAELGDQDGSQF